MVGVGVGVGDRADGTEADGRGRGQGEWGREGEACPGPGRERGDADDGVAGNGEVRSGDRVGGRVELLGDVEVDGGRHGHGGRDDGRAGLVGEGNGGAEGLQGIGGRAHVGDRVGTQIIEVESGLGLWDTVVHAGLLGEGADSEGKGISGRVGDGTEGGTDGEVVRRERPSGRGRESNRFREDDADLVNAAVGVQVAVARSDDHRRGFVLGCIEGGVGDREGNGIAQGGGRDLECRQVRAVYPGGVGADSGGCAGGVGVPVLRGVRHVEVDDGKVAVRGGHRGGVGHIGADGVERQSGGGGATVTDADGSDCRGDLAGAVLDRFGEGHLEGAIVDGLHRRDGRGYGVDLDVVSVEGLGTAGCGQGQDGRVEGGG